MLMSGMNQSAVRRVNTAVILRALAVSAGPRKLSELAGQTALSRRTVEIVLDSLVEAGWVAELDRVPISGSAGRPARRYELRAEHALLAAVRITTVDVSAVVADVRGRILGRAHRPLRSYQDPRTTLDDAAELVLRALDDAGGSVDRLRAGAVAAGGAIDDEGVVRRLVHTTRWEGVHLPEEFARRVPVPWFADNDANLGALAERWRGVADDHDNVVWAMLGNRTGLGILIRGAVHRGLDGAAGEIVEAPSMPAGSVEDRTVAALTSPLPAQRALARARFDAARAGDAAALAEVDEFVENIASILTTLSWTVAPSLIVLGGGLEGAADVLLPRVRAALRDARTPAVELRATALGHEAPLVGAVKLALDRMDTELFGPPVPSQ
ncbi:MULTISPECIES: ROK family transcriptional regulator [unclassified Streptomyces]|uniref:ROK family transcriptional regulator n=1 Tax=unclassified Streptomyces TaxID=2593676 RepID=UPI000F4ECEC2|nr:MULTISPECIES: ROK family transcriptional regulator [unclassified Streptomyces]MDH6454398.1 putative NBD/HSP70 family sugar kinase [Streptomyces sp. SAI-119]MDH6495043.1 putative NBD/HSP70 family sugar kinase [Streptomyces sp. SAI-149]QUC57836.1 ROK family protein [Streptomyces sp. A2-16]